MNGNSIHTITALLLQLIQASTHGVAGRIRKIRINVDREDGIEGSKADFLEEVSIDLFRKASV